jgi:hypothetical protein
MQGAGCRIGVEMRLGFGKRGNGQGGQGEREPIEVDPSKSNLIKAGLFTTKVKARKRGVGSDAERRSDGAVGNHDW